MAKETVVSVVDAKLVSSASTVLRRCCRAFHGSTTVEDKQTMQQLAKQYGRSHKTIARYLTKAQPKPVFPSPKTANLIIDTTYFKRGYGVMVLLDAVSKQALFVEGVVYETNALYLEAIQSLQKKSIEIKLGCVASAPTRTRKLRVWRNAAHTLQCFVTLQP